MEVYGCGNVPATAVTVAICYVIVITMLFVNVKYNPIGLKSVQHTCECSTTFILLSNCQ